MRFPIQNIWLQSKQPTELMLAKEWAESFLANQARVNIKEATITQYKRVYRMYTKNEPITQKPRLDINDINNLSCKNTRSFHRCSFRYCAAKEIVKFSITAPNKAIKLYKLVQKTYSDAHANQLKYKIGELQCNKSVKDTKRDSIIGLDDDWLAQLISLSFRSKFASHIRIMCLTGCRPSEFANKLKSENSAGIKVEILGDIISITIAGSKCSDDRKSGQEFRKLTFPKDHPFVAGLQPGFYFANSKQIQDAVRNYGKKIERKATKAKKIISTYSVRHQIASNLKSSNIDRDDISLALGHQSADTKSTYGSSTLGIDRIPPLSIEATNPVRPPKKAKNSDYIHKSKTLSSPRIKYDFL
ncbi:site-specific integrase [Methylotenera sp. N17]|uniref:site-specific integrase n=1 Tax=Methylotenera sp. N17 TaxID=1502761 RepID=UPI000646C520|nr:site-specific integrase [Methylotenera sp. N17]